ncbi:aquaporin 1 [Glomus cerebriforme]|uniref:Aquaporin 1 n=1 Tax=Glomus cerebriforme TaxID=658196 RepID=A0A397TA55_9GLOM|nr:aquaporin 1 [Glomus cerebriforme]
MGLKNDSITALAEFIGTTYFIFMGLGGADAIAAFAGTTLSNIDILATAFSFGWSLMINVWLWAHISGGVLNPAITLALMVTGDLEIIRGIFYIIAQFAGGIMGSLLVQLLQPIPIMALTTLANETSVIEGLLIEIVTTSLLTLTVYTSNVAERDKLLAAFGIGTSLLISILVAGPYTGASLNPARTFGPAIVAGKVSGDLWIYFLGPILGSLLAAIYNVIFERYRTTEYLTYDQVSFFTIITLWRKRRKIESN